MPKTIIFNKYQKRADNYHWRQISRNIFRFNAYVAARYQQVVNLIPQKSQQKILDIGCGDGVLLSLISQKTKSRRFGLDLDQASLDYAKTKVKAKFIQGSAGKIPFKNNFFDLVLATEIIEHLSQPEFMLQETYRVLKPQGKMILTTPLKAGKTPEDKLHLQEFSSLELTELLRPYFHQITIIQSHPLWLKKIYSLTLLKFGRFHCDLFRWLVNVLTFVTGYNLFNYPCGRLSQQLAVAAKKK